MGTGSGQPAPKTQRFRNDAAAPQPFPPPVVRWLVCLGCLLTWSVVLLLPQMGEIEGIFIPEGARFACSKAAHVVGYGLATVLVGWLLAPLRVRWLLVALLALHGAGTEFLQQFLPPRTPSWRDVGLNQLGILAGLAATWRWWIRE